MDLNVLDSELRIDHVLDIYKSLIWTERYYEYGDFELVTSIDDEILSYIKQDRYLQRKDSDCLMIIEKILITSSTEDGNTLTISGRSLESILMRRIVWGQRTITGNLQNGIKTLLTENIISPSDQKRKISNFVFKESEDPAITSLTIEAQYTGDTLYDVIQKICSEKDIGFKVTLDDDTGQFVFELYSGKDRSYDQTKYPYVVFSPKFDNIINSNYVESKSALKNISLVGGEGEGSEWTYTTIGEDVSGLARRELFVDARDISSDCNDDATSLFSFNEFPSEVFNNSTKTFVSDPLFNSSTADISSYVGRTVQLTIPQYTNSSGNAPGYATVILGDNKTYISTVKTWEKYTGGSNSGILQVFEFVIPSNAKYLYTSMFSQKAITDNVYYGSADDFAFYMVKLSSSEYIAQLQQRGKENLKENEAVVSFEGQVETTTMYRYGEDFFMGDVVQIANEYGHETKSRVLEIVTSDDEEGLLMYPTFATITEEGEEG